METPRRLQPPWGRVTGALVGAVAAMLFVHGAEQVLLGVAIGAVLPVSFLVRRTAARSARDGHGDRGRTGAGTDDTRPATA